MNSSKLIPQTQSCRSLNMADDLMQAGIFEGSTWWNTTPTKSFLPAPYWDPHMVDPSNLHALSFDASSMWNHQDLMQNGDYVDNGMFNSNTMINELNCGSLSPPADMNSSGTNGSTVTCDGQFPVVNSFSLLDHEILNPVCDQWNNISANQVMGSSFNQNQRQEQIIDEIRATLLGASPAPSSPSSPKPQSRKRTNSKKVNKSEEGSDSGSVGSSVKRQRIETPSSLPTFKVRKEKLGDRITALQQLVSPFGKTDTASVLHEAIEYIKFLHDQVNTLSRPYTKNGAPIQHHHHQQVATNEDLRSRGLCLVPISSTFPVAHETPTDFWTPTFGGTFR